MPHVAVDLAYSLKAAESRKITISTFADIAAIHIGILDSVGLYIRQNTAQQ